MTDKNRIIERVRSGAQLIDVHTHVGTGSVITGAGDFTYAQSAENLMSRLGRWGVDAAVCFPFLYSAWFDLDAFLQGRMSGSSIQIDTEINEFRKVRNLQTTRRRRGRCGYR